MEHQKEDVNVDAEVHIEEPDKSRSKDEAVDLSKMKAVTLTMIISSDEEDKSDSIEKESVTEKNVIVSLEHISEGIKLQENKPDEVKHVDRKTDDVKNKEKAMIKEADTQTEDEKEPTNDDDKDLAKGAEEDAKSGGDATVKDQADVPEEEEEEGTIPVPDSVRQCYYKFKSAWEACQEEINTSENYDELVCQIAAGGDQLLPTCWRAVIEKMKECNHPESLNMVIDKNQKRAAKACKELREKQITPPSKDKARTAMTD